MGRMSRGRRKLLLYGLFFGAFLLLMYKWRTCPEPEPQTMFMMPKDVSITRVHVNRLLILILLGMRSTANNGEFNKKKKSTLI